MKKFFSLLALVLLVCHQAGATPGFLLLANPEGPVSMDTVSDKSFSSLQDASNLEPDEQLEPDEHFETDEVPESDIIFSTFSGDPSDIELTAEITEENQTVRVNKYFRNSHTIDRWDGTAVATLGSDTTHTYTSTGTYTITLALTGGATRWTSSNVYKPLVPQAQTTADNVYVSFLPELSTYFGISATDAGSFFFQYFNRYGALTSLPSWSFDTSNITTVEYNFFNAFNQNGSLTSLPSWSFQLGSWLTTVGNGFFSSFNAYGSLTSLPDGSFDTSHITTAGTNFFSQFNAGGPLTRLPVWSFQLNPALTSTNRYFFAGFNAEGSLTSLPEGSFDTSHITETMEGFFYEFNREGSLTSLPTWSFDTSAIIQTEGMFNSFFTSFNQNGALRSLPEWSFQLSSWLTTVRGDFFRHFNAGGALTSLPDGSFNTQHITTSKGVFFSYFNAGGALTSLPAGSFNISQLTAGGHFFTSFNQDGALTSLPTGSFDTSNISTARSKFFSHFNENGALRSLPAGSFNTSTIGGMVQEDFFASFNASGSLTSLPEWSFDTSNIAFVLGFGFFTNFNYHGKLTNLPSSFKRPTNGEYRGWMMDEFENAFNSPLYTLNRNAADIINGGATPPSNRATFSPNQPGLCDVDDNRKVDPFAPCTPAILPTPPIVTLNGAATITLRIGATYHELWATWSDLLDGTGDILLPTSGTVNTNVGGTYLLLYSHTNSAGATASATRTVRVQRAGGGWGWGSPITDSWETEVCNEGDTSCSIEEKPECSDPDSPCSTEETESWTDAWEDSGSEHPSATDTDDQLPIITPENEGDIAYQWAYEHKITPQPSLAEADPDGFLLRSHLAKMVVQYLANILEQHPDTTKDCSAFSASIQNESAELQAYMRAACQYNVMGIHFDTSPLSDFMPNQIVSRAEFGTVLSRILRGDTYNDSEVYYRQHLQALKEHGILTQIDQPLERKELRKRAWLMLMRSTQS